MSSKPTEQQYQNATAPLRWWYIVHGILTLRCQDIVPLMSKKIDVPLTPIENTKIAWHNLHCVPCRHYEHHTRVIHQVVRAYSESQVSDNMSAEIRSENQSNQLPSTDSQSRLSDHTKQIMKQRLLRAIDGSDTTAL